MKWGERNGGCGLVLLLPLLLVLLLLSEPPPGDAPGGDCPDHGPYDDDECPKD